jgi:hypothetical protein
MRIEQTSPTTFELQSDSGCHAIAGFATETMGACGVYFWRGEQITRKDADAAFRADARVQKALSLTQQGQP